MKPTAVRAALLLLSFFGWKATPVAAQGNQYACKVVFSNKAGAPALSAAGTFLSARSLARRSRQGIALEDRDRPVSPAYVDTVLQLSGGVFHVASRWGNSLVFLDADTASLALLRQRSWVAGTEVVGFFPGGLHTIAPLPAAPLPATETAPLSALTKTTGSAAYYGDTWDQTALVHGDALHDAGFTGTGMLIAVIDERFTGSDTHPGFAGLRNSGRLVDTYNFLLNGNTDVFTGPSHGTQVFSEMAGFQPNSFVGSAPGAQYALYATEISGQDQLVELDNLVAAAERADSLGADILNISLGYNYFDYPVGAAFNFSQLDGHTLFVSQALNIAAEKGMLPVVSAGNEGNNSWERILAPADADSALTVGSVASNGVPAGSSGTGPNAGGRVKPDVVGMGVQAAVYSTSSTFFGSGTSYAAPQIAGWAACLWSANNTLSPGTIRRAIVASASRFANPDTKTGYGIPDFSKALKTVGVAEPVLPAGKTQIAAFVLQPNGTVQVKATLARAQKLQLQLFDITGRLLESRDWNAVAGTSETDWLPAARTVGLGLLKVQTEQGYSKTFKLVFP